MRSRRKRLPADLEASARTFDELVAVLERAKAALTDSVPGTRLPGRPLAETLWEFETGLREVRERMRGWRAPELEEQWLAADEGLDAALARAERLRTEAEPPAGFEELIAVVGDLLAPLESFEATAVRFRELER